MYDEEIDNLTNSLRSLDSSDSSIISAIMMEKITEETQRRQNKLLDLRNSKIGSPSPSTISTLNSFEDRSLSGRKMQTITIETSSNNSKENKRVSFSDITIREHFSIPGCNPGNPLVTKGPPIELSWDYMNQNTLNLDDYEEGRILRDSTKLRIPSEDRIQLLLKNGYRWNEILKCIKAANIARRKARNDVSRREKKEKLAKHYQSFKGILKRSKS